ncbi:ATPase, T2SS/T4P/T4SS family [Candidatus Omnitrophota bacterium]
MAKSFDNILAQALLAKRLTKKNSLEAALEKTAATGQTLAQVLIKERLVSETEILNVFSEKLKIPFISLKSHLIDQSISGKVPVKFTTYYKFMPVKIEGTVLTIACAYPLEVRTQDDIRMSLGYDIEMVLAREAEILDALKKHYGLGAETIEKILAVSPKDTIEVKAAAAEEKVEDIERLAEDASVIKLVNQIIVEAYRRRASDIHIEPYRGRIKLRYRIDGVLYNAPVPPEIKSFLSSILSRIKIMSNLNIVEHRLPQDGRAVVKVQDQTLDLRVSFIPTPYGESVVIRILPTKMLFNLEELGLLPEELEIFEDLIRKPHGIIFVTGPTGSGKTTTLYACLTRINTDERKIIAIEDPIEYEVEGITQIQVSSEIKLDFARGLRSMLRHDPDIMMVGEVRDLETAEIAIRVALTGHLVFSTLHTNDAASGITRLIDIGLEPYLVASSVEIFIAQRLVRLLCPNCREEDASPQPELKNQIIRDLKLESPAEAKIFKGRGCEKCNSTGFFGRSAIYEILLVDEGIRDLILKKAPSEQIKRAASARGMRSLRQNGWRKVINGETTPDEVMKVSQGEERETTAAGPTAVTMPAQPQQLSRERVSTLLPERRTFPRLDAKIHVHYKVVKQKTEQSRGGYQTTEYTRNTNNIGSGGLLFISDTALPPGTVLELSIDLPDAKRPIQCLCRVLRIEEVIVNKIFELAVCFLDIAGADRNRLNKYIEQSLDKL